MIHPEVDQVPQIEHHLSDSPLLQTQNWRSSCKTSFVRHDCPGRHTRLSSLQNSGCCSPFHPTIFFPPTIGHKLCWFEKLEIIPTRSPTRNAWRQWAEI